MWRKRGITELAAAAVDVAAPVDRDMITLTNRDWTFSAESLRKAARAGVSACSMISKPWPGRCRISRRKTWCRSAARVRPRPQVKVVLGPGTGLGMAALAPLPRGGWMPIPGELGHTTLPVVTNEELALKDKIMGRDRFAEAEDVLTGPGLLSLYRAVAA